MESFSHLCNQVKPFLGAILIQIGYAGQAIISKYALNKGMSQHVFVVYRHAVATVVIAPFAIVLDRKVKTKFTFSIFAKIVLLALLEPVIDQNLLYTGMKYTSATFTSAMCNIVPAIAFLMAWVCGLEKVYIKRLHSQAKVLGTIVTVGGAMLMSLVKGTILNLPWTNLGNAHETSISSVNNKDHIKGAFMIISGYVCWSSFIILQAITLKSYPAKVSLSALICLMGTLESSIPALVMEWGNPPAWSIHLNAKLLACVYSGVVCSGFAYYIQAVVIKERGPVFFTAFSPLYTILVAIMGSFILSEILYLGRVIGAVVIVVGLYLVLWGKSKEEDQDQDQTMSESNTVLPTTQNADPTVKDESIKITSKQ